VYSGVYSYHSVYKSEWAEMKREYNFVGEENYACSSNLGKNQQSQCSWSVLA